MSHILLSTLRHGVISQECEQSLLGADVGRIAEAYILWLESWIQVLIHQARWSLGWYESIFGSYLARKVSVMYGKGAGESCRAWSVVPAACPA